MSDLLVPIALSSQLDVTGEERIHAARYEPVVRAVYVGVAGVSIEKTLVDYDDEDESETVTEGDILNYSIVVTNTGGLTLHNVVISDDHFEETEEIEVLPIGSTATLLGSYTVTADDATAGEVVNTATVVADELENPVEDQLTTEVEAPASLRQFIIVNNLGEVGKSLDGQTWVLGGSSGTSNELRNISFTSAGWMTTSADDSEVYTSLDGDTWTPHTLTPTCDSFNGLPIAETIHGFFIARNEAKAYKSADGNSWSEIAVMSGSGSCEAIASNGTMLVIGDNNGHARRSSDGGSTWASVTVSSGADISDMIWNPTLGKWIMTISSSGVNIYTSSDAITWTAGLNVTNRLLGVASNGSRTVIVGDTLTLLKYSDDLVTWNDATHPFTNSVYDVDYDYNNNVWVAVGDSNQIAYSADGATWTAATSPFASGAIMGVAYGDLSL